VDPRVGLDDMEKREFLTLPGLKLGPIGRPARSQSLYRLRYPGSFMFVVWYVNTVIDISTPSIHFFLFQNNISPSSGKSLLSWA
jgi:hypothetical protein